MVRVSTNAATVCLTDDELAGFVSEQLAPGQRASLADHLDGCERCRRLISALAALEDDAAAIPDRAPALTAGSVIGRFTITRVLGQGAMGTVWAARDPELGREVAVKRLHLAPDAAGGDTSTRLRREAQAMARLNHPNVVAIYELGEDRGHVFCAMELVDGVTLRGWLATPRSWREVLEVARAAGQGLAAAHAAGLVHRDIKPENILIARDGRTLVTDFGLAKLADLGLSDGGDGEAAVGDVATARAVADRDVTRTIEHAATIDHAVTIGHAATIGHAGMPGQISTIGHAATVGNSATLTRTGALIGTPAYMAPEQLTGGAVGAHSDQFSFCVTIYEALFGMRPFAGTSVAELADAIRRGARKPDDPRGVPGAVLRCVLRGLAADPTERWPAMPALLEALARASQRRRRIIVAGIAAVALAATALVVTLREDRSDQVRSSAEARIARVWNPIRAATLRTAFAATGSPLAGERASHACDTLDRYRADWLRLRLDAWSAAHVRGEQSLELLAHRLACFERLADGVDELVTLWTTPSRTEVEASSSTVFRLEPIATCGNIDRVMSRAVPPSTPLGHLAERGQRRLEALALAGRKDEALQLGQALVDQALVSGDPGVLARARHNLGFAQANAGQLAEAEATLRLAVQEAAAVREHSLVAENWLRLLSLVGLELGKTASAASDIEPAARAAVAQAGNDPRQLGDLAMTLGLVDYGRGDLVHAKAHMIESRDRHLAALGPGHPVVANAEKNLGGVLLALGEYDAAARELEHAIVTVRATLGDNHPVIADAEINLGSIATRRKDWPAAEAHYRRALAVNQLVRGDDHPNTAMVHTYLARTLRHVQRFAEARAELDNARATLDRKLPPTHVERIEMDLRYGLLAEDQGDYALAERLARRTVDGLREIHVPALRSASALSELARIVARRSAKDSIPLYDEALTLAVAMPGRDTHEDAGMLEEIGRAALAAHQPELALGWFDRLDPAAAREKADLRAELEAARAHR